MFKFFGPGTPGSPQVERFKLPNFEEDEPVSLNTMEYKFQRLEGFGEDPALTLEEARTKAAQIRAEAGQKAKGIVAEAEKVKKQAAQLKAEAAQKGYDEGLEEGRQKGLEAGLAAFNKQMEPVGEALEGIEHLYQDLWRVHEPVLVRLAIQVAERVIFHELSTSPELVKDAFKAAMDHLQEQHLAVFKANPEDLDLLEEARTEISKKIKGLLQLSFQPDPNLRRGELIMETEAGRLDATLKQRLEAVADSVDEVLNQKFDLDW